LHWEVMRLRLAHSRDGLVVADGAPWVWNVATDRWRDTTQLLDFSHASQYLWDAGRALHGEAAPRWLSPGCI